MPIIEVSRVEGCRSFITEVKKGTNLYDWLCSQYFSQDIDIFINDKQLGEDDELSFPLTESDFVRIIDRPKSGGFLKTSALILGAFTYKQDLKFISKVFSKLAQTNAATGVNSSKTSSNNSIKSQSNIARNGEAIPDNYGLIRSFPDLIQSSLYEYVGNNKYITDALNFGIGRYAVSSVRYSESNLGSLAGASYNIYQPGQTIPQLIEGYLFDDVEGQEVLGANETDNIVIETATSTSLVSASFVGGQAVVKIVQSTDFAYFNSLAKPHAVTFTVNVTYAQGSTSVTRDATFSADLVSSTESNNGAPIPTYYYEFVFGNLTGADANTVPSNSTINLVKLTITENAAFVSGPYFSPVKSTDLWVHMQSALGPTDGTTDWKMLVWQVDDNNNQVPGTVQTFFYSVDNPYNVTTKTFYNTYKITPPTGYARYAFSLERTNNANSGNKLTVEGAHAINYRNNVVYNDISMVIVKVRGVENATQSRELKYNALINRYTIGYDYDNEVVDYTLRLSRSFANAVLHSWIVIGGQPASSLDIHELYTIERNLSDPRLGYFDYTFDDEDQSLGERIQTICDAATVTCFWDDGVLSFVRDESKSSPASVLSTRSLATDNYKLSYDMTLPGGYDGVHIEYRDPTTNKQASINYYISGSSILSGEASKPKKFDMLYVRNAYQARDRALKEVRRLLYSRASMTVTALADGEWVNVGQMIQVVDMYDTNQQSGYLKSRTGNNFETSEPIKFIGTMFVVVTDADGNPTDRYQATARTDGINGFVAVIPTVSLNIYNGDTIQQPSRYIIATEMELDSTQWIITSKKIGTDGKTALALSEYNSDMYNYTVPE